MTPERWQRISRIYHDALAQPPEARLQFVRDACGGDEHIEREVRSLVAQPESDSFLRGLAAGLTMPGETAATTPAGRLGRFELRGLLGVGGMGEVYRAHDSSLGRDVAVKLLPAAFTGDSDRLARFEREARVLAALSHPHIGALYGVEEVAVPGGVPAAASRALVLELVEGETLAERIERGRLPIDEAIEIGGQIADALEAAHEKGIVHRDLKPANVKIRPDGVVKVLDFGLAKAEGLAAGSGVTGVSQAPTAETSAGLILGTPAYMSPEQARGQPVDKRTDIWAFGCVLYEMLSGRAPFGGATAADIVAALLEREPDWSALPSATPGALRRLLRRCLEKNPKRRLRDIGDARLDLEVDRDDLPEIPPATSRRVLRWAAAAAGLLAAALVGWWLQPRPSLEPVSFTLDPVEGQRLAGVAVPSPDGRQLAFVSRTLSGESALWVRRLDAPAPRRLAGTDNAESPFWSADSAFIAFRSDGVLKRVAAAGGPVQRVTDLDPLTMGAAWSRDGVIVFTPSNRAPLHRVSPAGDGRAPLTALNAERRENSHRWPHFLPDGRHFLYTARSDAPENTGIYVASLDDPGSPRLLLAVQSKAQYVAPGHLLYTREQTLFAQPFDLSTLTLSGEPVAVAGSVVANTSASSAEFETTADGAVLTYLTAAPSRLVWFDRGGAEIGSVAARGDFGQLRLAPDGMRAAVVMPDPENGNRDVWVIALATGAMNRVTAHPAMDWFPVWSPDSRELVFASDREATPAFYRTEADRGGTGDRLVFRPPADSTMYATDWSRDGQALLVHSYPRGDISLLPLAAGARPTPLVESPFTDWTGVFSPDGRWVAYVSDESGADEVYVKPIDGGSRHRVSVDRGTQPRWRHDGRELFFLGTGSTLLSATIEPGRTPAFGAPRALFDGCPGGDAPFMYRYDVTADGARSLWICADRATTTVSVHALSRQLRR
jgi:Tol biopolymer transport system component